MKFQTSINKQVNMGEAIFSYDDESFDFIPNLNSDINISIAL